MKKAFLFLLLFIVVFVLGCKETPEEVYVISKEENLLEQIVDITIVEDQEITTPSHIDEVVYEKKNLCSIIVDAATHMPNVTEFPVVKITPEKIPQSVLDLLIQEFFPSQLFYLKPKEKSRDQISEEILQLTEDMENMELGSDDIETAMNVLEQLKEAFADAPETVQIEYVDPVFVEQEETKYEIFSAYTDSGYQQPSWVDVINSTDGSLWNMLTIYIDRDRIFLPMDHAETYMDKTEFPEEEALSLANKLLQTLGIDGFEVMEIDEAYAETAEEYGYAVRYRRSINGMPVTDSQIIDYTGNHTPMAARWNSDTICIRIGKHGVTAFEWDNYGHIDEVLSSNVELMEFNSIYDIARQQLKNKFAWIENKNVGYTQKVYIDRIAFEYRCVAKKNTNGEFILVPAWNFYGNILCENKDGTSFLQYEGRDDICHLSINAIDGTVIGHMN